MNVKGSLKLAAVLAALVASRGGAQASDFGGRLAETKDGAKIETVIPKGLADQLGLRVGDLIQKINKKDVRSQTDVSKAISEQASLEIQYKRDGREATITAEVFWPSAKGNKELAKDRQIYLLKDAERRPPVVLKKK